MSEAITLHVIVHGKVQGVSFRATAQRHAQALGLCGTAQNLADGTVELYLYGSRRVIETFLTRLRDDPGYGVVSRFESSEVKTIKYQGFDLLF